MSLIDHLPKPLQIEVTPWYWTLGGLVGYTLQHHEKWQEMARDELRALLSLHPNSSRYKIERARGDGICRTTLVDEYEDSRIPVYTHHIYDFLAAHARVHTLDKPPANHKPPLYGPSPMRERSPTIFEMVHAKGLGPNHRIGVSHEGEVVTKRIYSETRDGPLRTLWRGPLFQQVSTSDFAFDYDAKGD